MESPDRHDTQKKKNNEEVFDQACREEYNNDEAEPSLSRLVRVMSHIKKKDLCCIILAVGDDQIFFNFSGTF